MTNKITIPFLATLIILSLTMTGCRSSRPAVSESSAPATVPADTRSMTPAERVGALVASYTDASAWDDLYVPVTFNVRSPKSISVSGRMTMVRGSSISVSLRMLGFEVAGLYADRDSIIVYEKLNKSMVVEPMARLTALTGLTLTDLQDLLCARICYPGAKLDASNVGRLFVISDADNSITLTPRNDSRWTYLLSDGSLPELRLVSVNGQNVRISCGYTPAPDAVSAMRSSRLTLDATAGKTRLDADISFSLSSLKVNSGAKSERPSAKGYRRIDLARLVKSLGAF